jgi:hypothetical protein
LRIIHEQVQLLFREVARSVIALALMSPNLGKDGPVTVDISNFMAAKILDKWSRPSGVEYRCELELWLATNLVGKVLMGRVRARRNENGLVRADRLGTLRDRKKERP